MKGEHLGVTPLPRERHRRPAVALNPFGSNPFGNAVSLGNAYKHAMISELQVQFHTCTAPGKGQTKTLKDTLWLYSVVINTL